MPSLATAHGIHGCSITGRGSTWHIGGGLHPVRVGIEWATDTVKGTKQKDDFVWAVILKNAWWRFRWRSAASRSRPRLPSRIPVNKLTGICQEAQRPVGSLQIWEHGRCTSGELQVGLHLALRTLGLDLPFSLERCTICIPKACRADGEVMVSHGRLCLLIQQIWSPVIKSFGVRLHCPQLLQVSGPGDGESKCNLTQAKRSDPLYARETQRTIGKLPVERLSANGRLLRPIDNGHLRLQVSGTKHFTVLAWLALPDLKPQGPELIFALESGSGKSIFRWLSPYFPGGTTVRRAGDEVLFLGPGNDPGTAQGALRSFALSWEETGNLRLYLDGDEIAVLMVEGRDAGSLLVGAARMQEDFSGEIMDLRVWFDAELSVEQISAVRDPDLPSPRQHSMPMPSVHLQAESFCPRAGLSPWGELRERMVSVLHCATSDHCGLPQPMYRLASPAADVIVYRDISEYPETAAECPVGFAAAMVVICLFAQLEQAADAASVNGMLQIVLGNMPHFDNQEPSFGSAHPFSLALELKKLARQRFLALLSIPAGSFLAADVATSRTLLSSPSCKQRRRTQQLINSSRWSPTQPLLRPPLCVHVWHHGQSGLGFLRNTVESLASGGLLTVATEVLLTVEECGEEWHDPSTPSGWYAAWLEERFLASVKCCHHCQRCKRSEVELQLSTSWYLLPFRPELPVSRLKAASDLLLRSKDVFAVSLSEKSMQSLGGVASSFRRVLASLSSKLPPTEEDILAMALCAPSTLAGSGWNVSAAANFAFRVHTMFADVEPSPDWNLFTEILEQRLRPCKDVSDLLCVPGDLLPPRVLGDLRWASQEVWLMRANETPRSLVGRTMALSQGLFHLAKGQGYDPTAAATDTLGVPDCFACNLVPPTDDFTVYWVPVDVIAPCRELFSNLLLDTLEALHISSYQGAHSVLVEPNIANAVWQRYSEAEARHLKESGEYSSIYSFWKESAACGLRHGSAVPFSSLFDWDALVQWLRQARGIRGGASWRSFLAHSKQTLDVLAMLSSHPGQLQDGDNAATPCLDADEPANLRFFETDFQVTRRVCVRSVAEQHAGGFELRFLDSGRLQVAVRDAVRSARSQGRNWAAVGLFLYWVEGAERARLHPGRYGKLSSHNGYMSIWQGLRFAPGILHRSVEVKRHLGLCGSQRFLAAHWRRGDWFLGPHPRKLEQAALSEAPRFAAVLRRHLVEQRLSHIFLMTNAPYNGADVSALRAELPGVVLVQAPVLPGGDRENLRQLCVEMAVASTADFFLAFGDGLVQGMSSMPSLLVLQMRLHAEALPLDKNAFSFVPVHQDPLGI